MVLQVRIYRPAKSAAQAGRAKTHLWTIEPELLTPRQPESLMGWISAGDTLGELRGRLCFGSADEAISFAVRKGWDYMVEEPTERRITPRNYLDNFRSTRPEDEERRSGS